jgi:hypothetical protein
VRGSPGFRREAWFAARALGLEVRGYRPTARDHQALERREARMGAERRDEPAAAPRPRDPAVPRVPPHLRAIETVVRARVADSAERDRILARARDRIAGWLERGGRFDDPRQRRAPDRSRTH